MRRMRSPPRREEGRDDQDQDERAQRDRIAHSSRGCGTPALSAWRRRSARTTWARHSASETGRAAAASSSAIAVAGRCGMPLGDRAGAGRRRRAGASGTAARAIATSTSRANSATARPSGGSQARGPAQETTRKRPSGAERSERRPQPLPEIAHQARLSARASRYRRLARREPVGRAKVGLGIRRSVVHLLLQSQP